MKRVNDTGVAFLVCLGIALLLLAPLVTPHNAFADDGGGGAGPLSGNCTQCICCSQDPVQMICVKSGGVLCIGSSLCVVPLGKTCDNTCGCRPDSQITFHCSCQ
jgi:hypothetical protein